MIDWLFEILHTILPALHVLAAVAIIIKIVFVFKAKGSNVSAVVASFFRIYTRSDKQMTNSISRQQYMKINNYINYYLYTWILITVIVLMVFQKPY